MFVRSVRSVKSYKVDEVFWDFTQPKQLRAFTTTGSASRDDMVDSLYEDRLNAKDKVSSSYAETMQRLESRKKKSEQDLAYSLKNNQRSSLKKSQRSF